MNIDSSGFNFTGPVSHEVVAPNVVGMCGTQPYAGAIIQPQASSPGLFLGLTVTEVVERNSDEDKFTLFQNYPDPFNPTTVITYQVPSSGVVALEVFDLLGRGVKTVVNEYQGPGRYRVMLDAAGLASGSYFYRLASAGHMVTEKMVLTK